MILVTGGTGNIGSRLAIALKQRGASVRVLGLPEPQAELTLSRQGIETIHGDITRSEDMEKACMGIDTVYHLAALLSAPQNPALFRLVNTTGTGVVLRASERCGVRHFIFISSISVTYPRLNAYSRSKAEAEAIVRKATIPWTLIRPCLVLDGLGGGDEYRAFAKAVKTHRLFRLPESGKALKRPIHVNDLVEALTRIHANPITYGKTYPLGGLNKLTLREMARDFAGRKNPGIIPIPTAFLRLIATLSERTSRLFGRQSSRITHQSVDGLIFDAAPEIEEARRDLSWNPRDLKDIAP